VAFPDHRYSSDAGSIWALYSPGESYVALAWLFSFMVLANGITYVYFSFSNQKELEG
jgi:uncharacterized membrane protein HdeD (DUF308 family)